jgi:diaminopimelate epimerase
MPNGSVKTAIGPAVYEPEEVPLNIALHPNPLIDEEIEGYKGSAVNAGTTHFVTFVKALPTDEEIATFGPRIEHSPLFPERTSVIFAVEAGVRTINIRIWERGVGETLGCGTGSSAAAAEWMRKHQQAGDVAVNNPGGLLRVSAEEIGGSLVTSSEPVEVFKGSLPVASLQVV